LRGARFTLVGVLGLGANQLVLWALVTFGGIYYLVGAAIASQGSSAVTFAANELWVFRASGAEQGLRPTARRFAVFDAINSASLVLRLPVLFLLASVLRVNYLLANLVAIGVFTVVRFVVADGLIWRASPKTLTPRMKDVTT